MRNTRALLLFLLFAARVIAAEPPAFWVWHRAGELSAAELAELDRQQTRTLFWNIGTMELRGTACGWRS